MKQKLLQTTVLAIIACLLWSSAFVAVKVGLNYQSPLQFAGLRFILAGLILMPVIYNFKKFKKEVATNFAYVCLIAFLQVILQYSLFYMGINLLPASISAMIIGSSPLFIAVVAHFSTADDKMEWTKISSIILGIIGVAIITFGQNALPSGLKISLFGVLLLIMNNMASGVTNVVVARKEHSISPMILTSSSLFIGGVFLFLISIPLEGFSEKTLNTEYYVSLAWLGFLSAAAITIWNTLLRRKSVKVSELNVWKFLIPVSGAILSWLILPNDQPDIISVTGMIFIGASLLIINFQGIKRIAKSIKK